MTLQFDGIVNNDWYIDPDFLKSYNEDKKFDLILSKAGDNILMGNKKLDITQDVINGLNKRYKPTAKPAAEKAEEKKAEEKKAEEKK